MVHCRERLASARGSRRSHGEAPRRLGFGWLATVLAALAAMPHVKAHLPVSLALQEAPRQGRRAMRQMKFRVKSSHALTVRYADGDCLPLLSPNTADPFAFRLGLGAS